MDVDKLRTHFDELAASERAHARTRGVPLVAGYYAGVAFTLAVALIVVLGVRFG